MFPLVSEAVSRVMPVDQLRWVSFGHVEADECGAMNEWLAVAPQATVAQGMTGVMVSLSDLADRAPRALADGEVLDIGGHRMRWIDTPHVPHAWEAGLMYDETTRTLFCGDLFTQTGAYAPASNDDLVGPAAAAEDIFRATALAPGSNATLHRLADLDIAAMALMHGPTFGGDCRAALLDLADDWDKRIAAA
jgi:flavorubredoxin